MKNTRVCPKCGSTALYHVPPSEWLHTRGINVYTGLHLGGKVLVSRFICTRCGYVESWVEDPGALEGLRAKL